MSILFMSNQLFSSIKSADGFGAQYQRIIATYIFCKLKGMHFVYSPFNSIEHNYNNAADFIENKEKLINLKENIRNVKENENVTYLDFGTIINPFFEKNIDACCESAYMAFIKKCFWSNKERDVFNNGKKNVAIHIRRENEHDKGRAGERISTTDAYYMTIMKQIRSKYQDQNLLFHIFSQGAVQHFEHFKSADVVLHINTDVDYSFTCMVAADILVTSISSLSYVAALISDGEIWYKRFWHSPRKDWIIN